MSLAQLKRKTARQIAEMQAETARLDAERDSRISTMRQSSERAARRSDMQIELAKIEAEIHQGRERHQLEMRALAATPSRSKPFGPSGSVREAIRNARARI
jgi:hypothetical protein